MTGKANFGEDEGTLYYGSDGEGTSLRALWGTRGWQRQVRRSLGRRPLVWFVDDESWNRKWFAEKHAGHFAILTFSSLAYCKKALDNGTPCDVVVTDIFFPSKPVDSDNVADSLMGIYQRIEESKVSELPALWARERGSWHLDGFEIARVIARAATERKERIPVLLFSRKATLLLGTDDWLGEPPAAVENTFWLLEKVNPSIVGEAARKAASIQRERIISALRYRRAAAPWWLRLLGRLSLGWGPVSFSLNPEGDST